MDLSQVSLWSESSASGGSSGATTTHAAETGKQFFVTSISGHTDADSVIEIKSGSTCMWETKVDVSVEGWSFSFNVEAVPIVPGTLTTGSVSAGTSRINITGFTV